MPDLSRAGSVRTGRPAPRRRACPRRWRRRRPPRRRPARPGPGAGGEDETGVPPPVGRRPPLGSGYELGVDPRHGEGRRTRYDEQADRQAGQGGGVEDGVAAHRESGAAQQPLDGGRDRLRAALPVAQRTGEEEGDVAVGRLTTPGHDDEGAEVGGSQGARVSGDRGHRETVSARGDAPARPSPDWRTPRPFFTRTRGDRGSRSSVLRQPSADVVEVPAHGRLRRLRRLRAARAHGLDGPGVHPGRFLAVGRRADPRTWARTRWKARPVRAAIPPVSRTSVSIVSTSASGSAGPSAGASTSRAGSTGSSTRRRSTTPSPPRRRCPTARGACGRRREAVTGGGGHVLRLAQGAVAGGATGGHLV